MKPVFTDGAACSGALGPQLELNGELLDELPEEVGVAVLGELVEDKPVANLGLGEDVVEAFPDVLIVLVADLEEGEEEPGRWVTVLKSSMKRSLSKKIVQILRKKITTDRGQQRTCKR